LNKYLMNTVDLNAVIRSNLPVSGYTRNRITSPVKCPFKVDEFNDDTAYYVVDLNNCKILKQSQSFADKFSDPITTSTFGGAYYQKFDGTPIINSIINDTSKNYHFFTIDKGYNDCGMTAYEHKQEFLKNLESFTKTK
jgi:hypothetical protein